MSRMFGLVDSKVKEAEYFLERITAEKTNLGAVQYDTVAFASSARSITYAMQASLKGIPEFDEWYLAKQGLLKNINWQDSFMTLEEYQRISETML